MKDSCAAQVNDLCLQIGSLLLQNGAEGALIESTTQRLGRALNAEQVEVTILANAIIVTTRTSEHTATAVARSREQGVNFRVVTAAQRVMIEVENGALHATEVSARLSAIDARRYPDWLVILSIGLSCACFGRLTNSDLPGCLVTFVASAGAMAVRLKLAARHYNPILVFGITAFLATTLSIPALLYKWSNTPQTAMAASCLLLVPGVPLINGVSDVLKGYINMGIARWTFATLLTIASCAGIVFAMAVFSA